MCKAGSFEKTEMTLRQKLKYEKYMQRKKGAQNPEITAKEPKAPKSKTPVALANNNEETKHEEAPTQFERPMAVSPKKVDAHTPQVKFRDIENHINDEKRGDDEGPESRDEEQKTENNETGIKKEYT